MLLIINNIVKQSTPYQAHCDGDDGADGAFGVCDALLVSQCLVLGWIDPLGTTGLLLMNVDYAVTIVSSIGDDVQMTVSRCFADLLQNKENHKLVIVKKDNK